MGGGCVWQNSYSKKYPGFVAAKNGKKDHCFCNPCGKNVSIFHKGPKDIEKHVNTKEHQRNCEKMAGTQTLHVHFSGKK